MVSTITHHQDSSTAEWQQPLSESQVGEGVQRFRDGTGREISSEEAAREMVSATSRLVNTLAASVVLGCVAFVAWQANESQSAEELFQVLKLVLSR